VNLKNIRYVRRRYKKHYIPTPGDVDAIATEIVRLHDFYKFNLDSFASEGILESNAFASKSNNNLTVWDLFNIGLKGSSSLILGSGIKIMMEALKKSKLESFTVPVFVNPSSDDMLTNLIKTAKSVHDQRLDKWGSRTELHSVDPTPYNPKLRKKQKFLNLKPKKVLLNDISIWNTQQEIDQYVRICGGEELRPKKTLKKLFCKYEHRSKPYFR